MFLQGLFGLFALFSGAHLWSSSSSLPLNDKRLLADLKSVLRKTARLYKFPSVVGTEWGSFQGSSAAGTWGVRQVSQVKGCYQENPLGPGYDYHIVKATEISTHKGEGSHTVQMQSESLTKNGQCFMKLRHDGAGKDVFPESWFLVKEHAIGGLVDVNGLRRDMQPFSQAMLKDSSVIGVTETEEMVEGTRARCYRVKLSRDYVKASDRRRCKPHALVADIGGEELLDAVYKEVESWTEFLVSEVEGVLLRVRSCVKSYDVSPLTGEWECSVESGRDFIVTSQDGHDQFPDPVLESLGLVTS